jgi:hypothetical protein
MTDEERMQRESSLIATIRKKLPDFAKACADDTEHVLLHQDAFAADYQEDECTNSNKPPCCSAHQPLAALRRSNEQEKRACRPNPRPHIEK